MREHIEEDVRARVREIMGRGDGLILQGVLGVDVIALDEGLKIDRLAKRIKVYIPGSMEEYYKHYRNAARRDVVSREQASDLILQLFMLHRLNTASLIEVNPHKKLNRILWEERMRIVFENADEVEAFVLRQNDALSGGIAVAEKRGIPINRRAYSVP